MSISPSLATPLDTDCAQLTVMDLSLFFLQKTLRSQIATFVSKSKSGMSMTDRATTDGHTANLRVAVYDV